MLDMCFLPYINRILAYSRSKGDLRFPSATFADESAGSKSSCDSPRWSSRASQRAADLVTPGLRSALGAQAPCYPPDPTP